jgi:hypothetical protein
MSHSSGVSCVVVPTIRAQWRHRDSGLSLTGAVAASLVASGILDWDDLDSQVRVDWAVRRNQTAVSRLHVLCEISKWFYMVINSIVSMPVLLWPTKQTVKQELPDPVRNVRIRRSEFDLQFMKANAQQKEPIDLDGLFARYWKAIVAAEFCKRFSSN